MNHCKDCKHWVDPKGARYLCGGPPVRKGYGLCNLMRGAQPGRGTLAYPEERAGMIADLRTRAGFGCIQFEPKEQGS